MWTSEARKAEYIKSLKAQLGSVLSDLDNMPTSRLGSEWHDDRCKEVRWLALEIERINK